MSYDELVEFLSDRDAAIDQEITIQLEPVDYAATHGAGGC
jgi:hypothetical protein